MRLVEILAAAPGTHVWNFTAETTITSFGQAHRRLGSYLTSEKYQGFEVQARGAILTEIRGCHSEPVLIIEVKKVKQLLYEFFDGVATGVLLLALYQWFCRFYMRRFSKAAREQRRLEAEVRDWTK